MTKEADVSAGASGQQPPAAEKKLAGPSEPPAIQINMPKSDTGRRAATPRRARTGATDAVEYPLRNLMTRLDENDSRYGGTLEQLNQRVSELAGRSLASGFDALSHRMDDLAHRFDAALATKNDLAALRNIESQLDALTAAFTEAQQNYARVEVIEGNLANLMDRVQSGKSPGHGGGDRLEAIEHALRALNENARDMDARTVGALEAMSQVLHSVAASVGTSDALYNDAEDADMDDGQDEPLPPSDDLNAEVEIEERPEPQKTRAGPASGTARGEQDFDSNIPDYQPAPREPSAGGRGGTRPVPPPQRVEPTSKADDDFIASARRAMAAAAVQPPAPGLRSASKAAKKRLAGFSTDAFASEGKRTRPLLVIAVVGLLLTSAALLYLRLQTQSTAPSAVTSQSVAPQPPVNSTRPPVSDTAPALPAPKPSAAKKQQSERLFDAPATPARAARPVLLATPPQARVTQPTPAATTAQPGEPMSTATLLASLPPSREPQQMPDVSMAIKEPGASTPAPFTKGALRASGPALVPPAATAPRPDPTPMPKRAPAPRVAAKPNPAPAATVDSARANEVADPADTGRTRMPPARIGPQSLRMAAARGNAAAQVEIASRYARGTGVPKNLKKAAEWYRRAASQGYAPGQYRLAALYERGQGVKKDVGKARTWYRRAAEIGNIRAMHNLAVLYTRTEGTTPDYTSANNWFQEAARHGLADSQFNLGILYESGFGVKKNPAEAYKWFSLAARQGDDAARKRRETLHTRLPAHSLSAVEQNIRRWKPAPVKEAANRTRPPPGGWTNAKAPTKQSGDDAALIARAQYLLNKLGYDAGVADGKLGPQTAAAIRRFEGRTGIAKTGKVTPVLLQQLEALSS